MVDGGCQWDMKGQEKQRVLRWNQGSQRMGFTEKCKEKLDEVMEGIGPQIQNVPWSLCRGCQASCWQYGLGGLCKDQLLRHLHRDSACSHQSGWGRERWQRKAGNQNRCLRNVEIISRVIFYIVQEDGEAHKTHLYTQLCLLLPC